MIFYLVNGNQLAGTQADAKALDKDFTQIDIPTDKLGLMSYINDIMRVKDSQNVQNETLYHSVAVTHEGQDNTITVLARFSTITEAEDFLNTSAIIDPDDLQAGRYGIDAPEEMMNPTQPVILPARYADVTITIDEEWENLPLARKLHFASMACESARESSTTP
jgi:hypothetical protein